ncbi:MAG TPA: translocation/assembly module TamB domain-containing protein [Candidatus Eisenbacteria bacterium]|nr:translocation/assembly module TamB domain-containing protein [Candidatus Eisenbacteria bacterium]
MTEQEPREETPSEERRRRGERSVWLIVAGVVVLTVLLVLGGGVGVLTNLFASGDAGLSKRVLTAMNGALGSDSTRFAFDGIHGTLFRGAILERPRLIVRSEGRDVVWATAARARIDYDLWRLLFTSRRDLNVRLDSLQVVLARDSKKSFIMPRFRKGSGKPGSSETRINLSLRNASLAFTSERVSLLDLNGKGLVTFGVANSSVLVEHLTGDAHGGRATAPVRLAGMVVFQDSTWRLDPVRVDLANSRFNASGDWDAPGGRLREGVVHLEPLVLGEFLPLLDVQGVAGVVRGDLDLAGRPEDGTVSGCLSGELAGEKIDTLLVNARLRRDGVIIEYLDTKLRGATVTGRGRIDPNGALDATLAFRDANPASLPWWEAPAGMPKGALAGQARLRVSRGRPRPAIRLDATLAASRVGRLPIDRAAFLVHAPPEGGLFVDSLTLDSPGGRLTGQGSIDREGGLRATANASVADLGRMGLLLAPMTPREGRGRATAVFGGTTKAPTIDVRGAFAAARFESGLRADSVTVSAAGPLAPTLDLRGALRVAGLAAKERPLGDVEASFQGGKEMRVDRFRQSAGDTTLSMQGVLTFETDGVRARVDSLRLVAGSFRATAKGATQATYSRGRLRAAPLVFDLEPGRLDADLDWDVTAGRIDVRGSFDGLDLARLGGGASGREAQGRLRAQFLASGPVADPDVTIRGTLESPRFQNLAADSIQARLEYAPGVLSIESLRWDVGATSADLRGSVRTKFTLESWLRALARGDRAWTRDATLALEAAADSFELTSIAPVDSTLRTLRGAASFRGRIGGTVADPTLALTGRVPGFGFHTLAGDIAALECGYRDQRLTLDRLEFRQGKGVMTVAGMLPLDLSPFATRRALKDQPLRLSIRANETDFSTITALSALVATSSGAVSGDAEVTGTLGHPRWSGSVRLRDGRVRFAGRYEVLEGIDIDGTFDEERLTLTKIDAREGKRGRVSGSGYWRWSGASQPLPPGSVGPPGEYNVTLKATDCVVTDREYYLFQFSGNFIVTNGKTPYGIVKPRITGSGSVSRGELAVNLSAPVGEPPPALPFLYDVTADFPRQFKYKQLDTEVDLAGSLQLRNEGEGDIALGILTVKGGQFYFLTRKFSNLTGEVNFNNLDRLDPFVSIDAETRVQRRNPGGESGEFPDHVVNLAITGRSSQLQIQPWDVEGTGTSDLWRELSVGQFSSPSQADNGAIGDQLSGVQLRDLPVQGYLFRNVEQWLSGSGYLDTIDIRPGSRKRADGKSASGPIDLGLVGVGKFVTRDLFLKYSNDFAAQSEQQITAEYRVTRHLLLRGQQILGRQSSLQSEQEFNLDLKIRVEY